MPNKCQPWHFGNRTRRIALVKAGCVLLFWPDWLTTRIVCWGMTGQANAHVFSVNFHWQDRTWKIKRERLRERDREKQRSVLKNKMVGMAPWENEWKHDQTQHWPNFLLPIAEEREEEGSKTISIGENALESRRPTFSEVGHQRRRPTEVVKCYWW